MMPAFIRRKVGPMALTGVFLFLFGKRHPAIIMLDRYYMALKVQDYATAFHYLDSSIKTPQGEPVTLDWFSRRARAYDKERGKISRTALTKFSLNQNRADFTTKVTREKHTSYKVQLNASGTGDTWKITGFTIF